MTPSTTNATTPRRRSDLRAAILFLLPNLFGVLAFVVFPVVFSLVMAFTNWDLTEREPFSFVGVENFRSLLWGEHSRSFWKYFLNTLYFLMGMPLSIVGAIFLAVLLHQPIRVGRRKWARHAFGVASLGLGIMGGMMLWSVGRRDAAFGVVLLTLTASLGCWLGVVFFRTLFYLPQFTAGVATYILWRNLFNPEFGLVNRIICWFSDGLAALGLGPFEAPQWLGSVRNLWGMDPEHVWPTMQFFGLGARDALIFMGVWAAMGGTNMLLYLAGLSNLPQELYEVAELDGAGRGAKFRHVTWPALAPITLFIVIISLIGGLQGGFEQARVMTNGGPAGTTMTLGYYIYTTGFEEFRLGLASAIAWIMFVLIFAITIVNWRFGNRYANV